MSNPLFMLITRACGYFYHQYKWLTDLAEPINYVTENSCLTVFVYCIQMGIDVKKRKLIFLFIWEKRSVLCGCHPEKALHTRWYKTLDLCCDRIRKPSQSSVGQTVGFGDHLWTNYFFFHFLNSSCSGGGVFLCYS